MTFQLGPIVDNWYYLRDKGQRFHVVAINEDKGIIETQHIDGDLEEISLDDWYNMNIIRGAPPENWYGAMDVEELDDLGTEITDTTMKDFTEQLEDIKKPQR